MMVTIAIDERIRRKLLMIAATLQKKFGRKINYNDVLEYLTQLYEENTKNPEYFRRFCEPIQADIKFNEVYGELIQERRRDENRYGQ
jgi:hypothetical protein